MHTVLKNRGFMIIELLIVVFIIAILASIIIPALYAAKQKADQVIWLTTCDNSFLLLNNM